MESYKNLLKRIKPQIVFLRAHIATIIAIMGCVGMVFFYIKYREATQVNADPAKKAREETRQILSRMGKYIALPTDEEPTVATVSDVEKLRDRPFFANAKNGDKVLVYTNAKKAILYDPIANKIIDVAPVNIASPTASIHPTDSIPPDPFMNF